MTTTANSPIIQAAYDYAQRGWPVLPLKADKHPWVNDWVNAASDDQDQISSWWRQRPDSNVGILTGERSGIFVLDIDARSGGLKNLDLLQNEHGGLPNTLTVQTGGGGLHYYFKYPDCGIGNASGDLPPGIDVRGQGGQVVAPPSVHQSGITYFWLDYEPGEIDVAQAPGWLVQIIKSKTNGNSVPRKNGTATGTIPIGKRNETLASLAGTMRRRGMEFDEILAALLIANQKRCEEPLSDDEVRKIVESICRYQPENNSSENSRIGDENTSVFTKWPVLADEAFHGLAGDIVKEIDPHTEADPAALLIQFLIFYGSVVGRGPHFRTEADEHHMNLFCCLVGETAKGKKGSSLGQIKKIFKNVDDDWAKDCIHSGLSSGEGLIWCVRDEIKKLTPVKKGGIICDYQEEIIDPGVKDKRALIIESEFASTLRVMGREGNSLSPKIRDAWDGIMLKSLTKNSPAKATDPHISIIAHVTRGELARYMDSTECGNGFANRFNFVCVKRSKVLPDGGKLHEVDFAQHLRRLNEAVEFARTVGELKRDDDARAIWREVYPKLSEGKPGLLGAVIARAEAQTMRYACEYALLDLSSVIRMEHLNAALALWGYCEQSAGYIFGESLGDPDADLIKRTLDQTPKGLTRTEISNLFGRNKNASQIQRVLDCLIRNGSVYSIMQGAENGGRSTERWLSMRHSTN